MTKFVFRSIQNLQSLTSANMDQWFWWHHSGLQIFCPIKLLSVI